MDAVAGSVEVEDRSSPPIGRRPSRLRSFSLTPVLTGSRIIVLALDHSDNARIAFNWYVDNIYKKDDLLVLVHCPEAPRLPSFSFKSGIAPPVQEWKSILDEMNTRTRRLEEDYEGTCIQKKLRYKVRGEATKNPGEEVLRICDEEKADMVVVGAKGAGRIKKALLGHVSDYIARNANCPVIMVPTKKSLLAGRRTSDSLPE